MKSGQIEYPEHIVVIGGGRWARVLIEALCAVVLPSSRITVYTVHNVENMIVWADDKGLLQQIQVTSNWPHFKESEVNAAIVVNAARDHERVIEKLLLERVPVLAEKPVTLTAKSTQRLMNLAVKNNTYFAAAHIFLYATYIEEFLKLVTNDSETREVIVNWVDPGAENRYGETKQFDPGLPIIADWFPHILTILSRLLPENTCTYNNLDFSRGGASLDISMTLGKIPCRLKLERNGAKRQRILGVKTVNKLFQLDFSIEPGLITIDNNSICSDNNWRDTELPSALILKSFLNGATSGKYDNRIDIKKGLYANKAIDQAMILYRREQAKWLSNRVNSSLPVDEDLHYLIGEIFQAGGLLSVTELEDRLGMVQDYLSGSKDNTHLIHSWLDLGYLEN